MEVPTIFQSRNSFSASFLLRGSSAPANQGTLPHIVRLIKINSRFVLRVRASGYINSHLYLHFCCFWIIVYLNPIRIFVCFLHFALFCSLKKCFSLCSLGFWHFLSLPSQFLFCIYSYMICKCFSSEGIRCIDRPTLASS